MAAGAQVHLALLVETLHQQVEQIHPAEVADGVVEIKRGEDLADVRREAHHILAEVQREISVVMQEALVVELGGIVEGVTGGAAQLPVAVLQTLFLQGVLSLQHLVLGLLQRVVQTAQHGERQDDLLELALLESTIEQIGNRPEEADDGVEFGGFVHGIRRHLESGLALENGLRGRGGACRR